METYGPVWVNAQVAQTVELWDMCAATPNRCAPQYTASEQAERELVYDEALQTVERDLDHESVSESERLATRNRIVASFGQFSARALGLNGDAISLLTREFLPVGTGLAQWARRFDPSLSMPDITQAARNAWTACGLQPLLGDRVTLTPAIFGYSLLYPYSDNYLDDPAISAAQKLRFSERFRCRLQGVNLPAADERERAMWALIALIETQYPRALYPHVYECLLAIHHAQEQSVAQLCGEVDPLRLSCAKGGTSVLADACLVRGSLTEEESRFAFEWGVLLQLGDDLQDLRDDLQRGSVTVFSRAAASANQLDSLTVQLLNFSDQVSRRMETLPQGSTTLKELLKMSWRSLIIRAVADSHEFFSPGFLKEAERQSPFRFHFLRARSTRLASRHGLYTKLFTALLPA